MSDLEALVGLAVQSVLLYAFFWLLFKDMNKGD